MGSQLATDINANLHNLDGNQMEAVAQTLGKNMGDLEQQVMLAYSLKPGDETKKTQEFKDLVKEVYGDKPPPDVNVPGLQVILQQRYSNVTQAFNMALSLLDKMDRIRQKVIDTFAR